MKRTCIGLALVAALAVGSAGAARAGITFENTTNAPLAGANYVNFNGLQLGNAGGVAANTDASKNTGGSILVTLAPNPAVGNPALPGYTGAAARNGAESGNHAPPWITYAGNQVPFAIDTLTQPDNNPDTSTYLTSGLSGDPHLGKISLTFNSPIHYFGLLWGSIDKYNTLSFFDQFGVRIGESFTGGMVDPFASGSQEAGGTRYINFTSTEAIYKVEATSSEFSFELDNVAYSATPEAATLTIWSGLGLCGWFAYRRGRK